MVPTAKKDEHQECEFILQMKEISKIFPGVKALDNVNLDIKSGEVHALVGENGAGKSTLMKVLAGMYKADSGQILYKGNRIVFNDPLHAKEMGIILVHQELSLVPDISVAENIFLGSLMTKRFKIVDWMTLKKKARNILDGLECYFDENQPVGNLTIAKQQMVEIARALAFNAEIVIFDEPTASLTDYEKNVLFRNINLLKKQGKAVIYITHKMDELFEISDRITVLRDGKKTGTLNTESTNKTAVIELMIGRKIDIQHEEAKNVLGEEVLRVENLTFRGLFEDVSFAVNKGEVLGLYGLVGAGRSEVAETIFGVRKAHRGKIYIEGQERKINNSETAVNYGIGFVPEDRKQQGLVLGMSVAENISLASLKEIQRCSYIQNNKELTIFQEYKEKLAISTTGPKQQVVNLSGGNQQKIVIAKWLCLSPKLLILDEPTRGIDVGSKSEIHKLIRKLAKDGLAVLVISSEMAEIMSICDRIVTMYEGKVTGEFDRATVTEGKIIHAISSFNGNAVAG